MKIKNISSRTSPLCFLPNGNLISYKDGKLYVVKENTILKRISLFESFKEKYIGKSKIAFRFLRLGVRSAIALDNNLIILSVGNILYEYNLQEGVLSEGYNLKERIRPLYFSNVEGIEGFEDMLVFGGYLSNMDKNPVHIYKRVARDSWEIIYTFPKNAINHIHNIIPDPYRKCLWVFTGDFNSSSAIWEVSDNFRKIECVLSNSQKYRGCVAFVSSKGLLYATDTPFEQNYIYLMKEDYSIIPIEPINGSCIYGCKWKDNYVFSSTVEADGRNQSILEFMFSRKRGAGIRNDNFYLYIGNIDNGFNAIHKFKKDFWPFIFQFGAFKFPFGINNSDYLYFQPVASSKNDLDLMSALPNI